MNESLRVEARVESKIFCSAVFSSFTCLTLLLLFVIKIVADIFEYLISVSFRVFTDP